MKDFDARIFMDTIQLINRIRGEVHYNNEWQRPDPVVSKQSKQDYTKLFMAFKQECEKLGLLTSIDTSQKIIRLLTSKELGLSEIDVLGQELMGRLCVELKSRIFFSIELENMKFLLEKHQFGNEVNEAFPTTNIDIEEAGKCLALDRYTACVFHLMRVMEVGIKSIGNYIKIPELSDIKNKSWESILRICNTYLKESKSKDQFLIETVAMLHSVKDAWRNPTMHAENIYIKERAMDVWNAVRSFMQQLSTKLHE